jgi:hypothetical protein
MLLKQIYNGQRFKKANHHKPQIGRVDPQILEAVFNNKSKNKRKKKSSQDTNNMNNKKYNKKCRESIA